MVNKKVLLVQTRKPDFADHEITCFLRHIDLKREDLIICNALEKEVDHALIDRVDGVVVGGSAECNVSKRQPAHFDNLIGFIKDALNSGKPFLGICYGAHLLTAALGGEVVFSPRTKEVGTTDLILRPEAINDPLFKDLPDRFAVGVGHTDLISRLPDGAVPLADTEMVNFHAFKVPGRSMIYGIQYHPELGKQETIERMTMVFEGETKYFKDRADFDYLVSKLVETPLGDKPLQRFIDQI